MISLHADLKGLVIEYVHVMPEVFLNYDISRLYLEDTHEDGFVATYDIVVIEDDKFEVVIGEARVGTDMLLEIDIFED